MPIVHYSSRVSVDKEAPGFWWPPPLEAKETVAGERDVLDQFSQVDFANREGNSFVNGKHHMCVYIYIYLYKNIYMYIYIYYILMCLYILENEATILGTHTHIDWGY